MLRVFNKLIDKNPNIAYCIGTIINEYDIKRAHPTACYFIFGKDMYDQLMAMDKLKANTMIGKMMRDDPTLYPKLEAQLKRFMNEFCVANNVDERNFVSSTRDSMILVNKKPIKTVFENGLVNFVNKEGEYTTYIRLNNLEILFDSMSGNMRIKGINEEYVEGNEPFVKLLKQMLRFMERAKTMPFGQRLREMNKIRDKYADSKDKLMYASLLRGNKYQYLIDSERVESDGLIESEGAELIRDDNYINFILPLMKIVLTH